MKKECLSGRKLWKCGTQTGFYEEKSGALRLAWEENTGIYISQSYDSGRRGMEWNRIALDTSPNLPIQVYVWLYDEEQEGAEADNQEGIYAQFAYVKARAQYTSNYHEMLLYGKPRGKGRFAKLAVEVFRGEDEEDALLRSYQVSFPKESFTQYLPAIYGGNSELERFLAVQQNIYLDLESQIDNLANQLDYDYCSGSQIRHLAGWMGWGELAEQADEETLRRLLRTGTALSSQKGTCMYYTRLAEILTERKAVLLEEQDGRKATLLIKGKPDRGRERYLEWMRRNVPIGITMEIVILHRTDRLDGQYFLDVTSFLSLYESQLSPMGVNIDGLILQ